MTRIHADQCIYVCKRRGLIISVYVDDILIMAKDIHAINKVKKTLTSRFKMTDLGQLRWYLGMRVQYKDNMITLDQEQYVTKMLERFHMTNAKPQGTPIASGADKKLVLCKDDKPTNSPYRELVGSLLYLTLSTRPDIAVAVCKLARLVSNATDTHWRIAKGVLRYLIGTTGFGLHFKRNIKAKLTGYVDASWADDRNSKRNSTTGYLCFFDEKQLSLVDWTCKLQGAPAHSTAESELMAADEIARNVVWLRTLFREIGIEQKEATIIHEDNQACIRITEGGGSFQAKKHIELRYFYIQGLVNKGIVKMSYIETADQVADILTKLLDRPRFQSLRSIIVNKI